MERGTQRRGSVHRRSPHEKLGFAQGKACPRLFRRGGGENLVVSVHADDFVTGLTEAMQMVARMLEERMGAQRTRSSWRGGAGEKGLGKNHHGIRRGGRPTSHRDLVCDHRNPDGLKGSDDSLSQRRA